MMRYLKSGVDFGVGKIEPLRLCRLYDLFTAGRMPEAFIAALNTSYLTALLFSNVTAGHVRR